MVLKSVTKLERKRLQRNFWLLFIFSLSQRRLFYTLIGIYFLTLPGANDKIQMLGMFISAGAAVSFLLEIPSGYIADLFGHKKSLILAKIIMIFSTLMYIFANHWIFFLLGSMMISAGWSFQSGTLSAIFHNTTEALNRENDFTKLYSKMRANVSIPSVILLIIAPFLFKINILAPFYLALGLDFVGFVAILFVISPRGMANYNKVKKDKKVREIFQELRVLGFVPFVLLGGFLAGINSAMGPFREVFLQDLGMDVALVGFLAGVSRMIWFIVGHLAHKIEKLFSIKQIMFSQLLVTVVIYFLISFISNPYLVLLLMAMLLGSTHGISVIKQHYFLNKFVVDDNYKATALSIKAQVASLFAIPFSFGVGYLMKDSYSSAYFFVGVSTLGGGLVIWQFLKNKLN